MIEYSVTCIVGGKEVLCDLKYDQENPAEVSFTFHVANRSPEWIFSRSLIKEVLSSEGVSGHGDVMFYDHGDMVSMLMRAPEGTGMAMFYRNVLFDFVNATYRQVKTDDLSLSDEMLDEWLQGLV